MNKTADKDKKISLEIIRFLITGVVCALLDFLVSMGVKELLHSMEGFWRTFIYTACGFTVGVIANYLLSTFWVFKNTKDKKASKKPLFIVLFVILSMGAWLLSFLTELGCTALFKAAWSIDISEPLFDNGFSFDILKKAEFWLFGVSFVSRTLVGMIWNYLTRKFILYKAPKKEEEEAIVEENTEK